MKTSQSHKEDCYFYCCGHDKTRGEDTTEINSENLAPLGVRQKSDKKIHKSPVAIAQ